ncbi:MAG: multiheme c-type cytochrome [Myxococcota bacterium]
MAFRSAFFAVVVATALLAAAFGIHSQRPAVETGQPTADLVRATGKCAECHRRETGAVVHQFELSRHAAEGVNCLDCHQPGENQEPFEHRGFTIARELTAANCAQCHATQYQQFARSRHAAPAWAAVRGARDFTAEQIAFAEDLHPGWVDRPPNVLALLEGEPAIRKGCAACHSIGRPNADGSIGSCTQCHARHVTSLELARLPATCGQCHMGPDHAQVEIYRESKHGVLFDAERAQMNLRADPKHLSTADMFVPTCATCHMSGLDGLQFTHDTTLRLSTFLFAPLSEKRPGGAQGELRMKEVCQSCHVSRDIDRFFLEAHQVVRDTNARILEAKQLVEGLAADGITTPAPFDQRIDFVYFDMWHYYGRTAKHGAFMGGADFVQWHGNYELLQKMVELRELAEAMRREWDDGEIGTVLPN